MGTVGDSKSGSGCNGTIVTKVSSSSLWTRTRTRRFRVGDNGGFAVAVRWVLVGLVLAPVLFGEPCACVGVVSAFVGGPPSVGMTRVRPLALRRWGGGGTFHPRWDFHSHPRQRDRGHTVDSLRRRPRRFLPPTPTVLGFVPATGSGDCSRSGNFSSSFSSFSSSSSTSIRAAVSTTTTSHSHSYDDDTIFALSSGGGGAIRTAVAVVRISGRLAGPTLEGMMTPTSRFPPPRYAALRTLVAGGSEVSSEVSSEVQPVPPAPMEVLDEALVLWFPGPRSFTGEDVVELHLHGSRAVVSDVLRYLSTREGLRPADRGEFTKRAYGNGRLGLVEVEALADLVVADTSAQRRQALGQMDGRTTRTYERWRDGLVRAMAHAEAVVDFGDDEFDNNDNSEADVWAGVRERVAAIRHDMQRRLNDGRRAELVRSGLAVALVGRPNAGKSSLLNVLSQKEAAIVGPRAGTTRDVLEVRMDLGGVPVRLLDTAGLRGIGRPHNDGALGSEPEEVRDNHAFHESDGLDEVEVEGIRRALKAAEEAQVLLWVRDASAAHSNHNRKNDNNDNENNNVNDDYVKSLLGLDGSTSKDKQSRTVLEVRNKIDLIENENDESDNGNGTVYRVSCTTGNGVDELVEALVTEVGRIVGVGDVNDPNDTNNPMSSNDNNNNDDDDDSFYLSRERHRRHVQLAEAALSRFLDLAGNDGNELSLYHVDLAAEELRVAATEIGRVTGAVDVEEVLDVLFRDFCIGK